MCYVLATEPYQTGFCNKKVKIKLRTLHDAERTVLIMPSSYNFCCAIKPAWNNNTTMSQTRNNKDYKQLARFAFFTQSVMK